MESILNREKVLEVKDLHVSFTTFGGMVRAVRGVNFDLYKGETFAIVGESGSGKSITTRAIMGILASNAIIDKGEILYKGENIVNYTDAMFTDKVRGKAISMVFQDPMSSLNPIMKIGKQISEALILNHGMTKREAMLRAIQLMTSVGIPDAERRATQYPFQFSGGMRQRIVIACALACEPEILICDEPTTALDVTVQAQVLELIKDIQKERDLTVIFITHDLGVVAGIADRVAVMYGGKIVELGTTDDVFYNPQHPYTWNLMAAMPDLETDSSDDLISIPGTPPNMLFPPKGDAFAPRNKMAMKIDFEKEPPMFRISETHSAATWLLHKDAPKVELPEVVRRRIDKKMREVQVSNGKLNV